MLQKIGTVSQVKKIKEQLHPDLYQAVVHDLHLLDSAYGADRDYFTLGGYSMSLILNLIWKNWKVLSILKLIFLKKYCYFLLVIIFFIRYSSSKTVILYTVYFHKEQRLHPEISQVSLLCIHHFPWSWMVDAIHNCSLSRKHIIW